MPRTLQGQYNLFGQWVIALCSLHKLTVSELARKAGLGESTLHESLRERKSGPSIEIVHKVWDALVELTGDSGLRESLPASKMHLYNIAGYASPEQQEFSKMHLTVLEHFARDEKEANEREAYIKRLEEDIKRLDARRRPRSSSADGK